MEKGTTYVGMDVHKRTIAVSIRFPDGGCDERTIPHGAKSVDRLVRKLEREARGPILCAYETVRDLCRAREDAKEDQVRARHRLGKFLLRRGLRWGGRTGRWLNSSG